MKTIIKLLFFDCFLAFFALECGVSEECNNRWPGAFCLRGRCKCPVDTVRKTSDSRGWICLAVNDAVTGDIGSPLTCPLPIGAGYNVVRRNGSVPILCSSRVKTEKRCPIGYECISGHGVGPPLDGACCPNQETSCQQPVFDHESGPLSRWGWDGESCVQFRWDPQRPSTANNFLTRGHCESYCLHDIFLS
ncbi:unnamed protein product, partial [Mesorhabditis belari]|uniref:BPTI/Kunitz inhibitor domain-containing protein n=1 Tax=Mesorhabditis belari TaxID=2138241 RepID=A0AAF3E8F5_9BILA